MHGVLHSKMFVLFEDMNLQTLPYCFCLILIWWARFTLSSSQLVQKPNYCGPPQHTEKN